MLEKKSAMVGGGICGYTESINSGEKHCRLNYGSVIFDFTIQKGEKDGEYIIDGFIDPSKGDLKSINHMVPAETRFFMLVARSGVIVDSVGFRPRAGFGNTDREWPFTIYYNQPEGFDGLSFAGQVSVRG